MNAMGEWFIVIPTIRMFGRKVLMALNTERLNEFLGKSVPVAVQLVLP